MTIKTCLTDGLNYSKERILVMDGMALDSQRFLSRLDSLYFVDENHQQAFVSLLKKYDKAWHPEYASAFYILTIDGEMRHKCVRYIDDNGIDFCKMLSSRDFSSVYRMLVIVAYDLFNWVSSEEKVSLSDIACMSSDFYLCVVDSLKIRRGQLPKGLLEC